MSDKAEQPEPRLPGYELIEKIGAGGYGEVWSAVAPGGLRKAVKYVFGNEFDKRAKNELHSLEKVKSVRHPFLLSLERIEILDGRLIVVSELADGSLRDRFCECVKQGLPGIPREELLGYLADTADALDFISREHDLAHLDIKPENLLLVAGHVKVADFGLVKSVASQTQASLVGGMTPTYAAPEVFRGVPGRQSDQYSLAILYQEMLTGVVPFSGANAAELTLQHMNDDPNLSHLGEGDRFAVSRALAKDPAHRYESARALVEAVRNADSAGPTFAVSAPAEALAPRPTQMTTESKLDRHSATEAFAEPNASASDRSGSAALTFQIEDLDTPIPQQAAPPAIDHATPFAVTPSLFIGIGSTGARVLRSLRRHVNDRLGTTESIPSAPMLLLDTNTQTLATATRNEGLAAAETIALPLRRPQAYREKADTLLRWLGRRWLYNIPRSLQTEGIRPLGRLALVDHARQTFQRIRGVVSDAVDESSREASAGSTGLPFTAAGMRVYVVAASSGGAGSGMAIDVAYAVRAILARIGVANPRILGLMTHSTSRDAKRVELARVNSYAWLSEFENFRTSAGGYPGDQGVGLPPHEPGVAPFDHTYFLPLGEQMDTPAFESAADAVAEYLFTDAFTSGQHALDACREDNAAPDGAVRSFAVRPPSDKDSDQLSPLQHAAIERMLSQWLGEEESDAAADCDGHCSTDQVVHGTVAFLGKTQLDSPTLVSNCRALLEASLGGDASAYVEARFGDVTTRDLAAVAGLVDEAFGVDGATSEPGRVVAKPISDVVTPIADKLERDCVRWVLERINSPQERLNGALRASEWLLDYLGALAKELNRATPNLSAERARWVETASAAPLDVKLACAKLFHWRLDEAGLVAARLVVEALGERVNSLPRDIDALRANVLELKQGVASELPATDVPLADANEVALAIEQCLQAEYLGSHGGLLRAISDGDSAQHLGATIAHVARLVTRDASDNGPTNSPDGADDRPYPAPPLDGYGGTFRHLAFPTTAALHSEGTESDEARPLLVTEMDGVSLKHVAADLIGRRRDYAAFAERVRTRRDIPWSDPVTGAEGKPETSSLTTSTGFPAAATSSTAPVEHAGMTSPAATAVLG